MTSRSLPLAVDDVPHWRGIFSAPRLRVWLGISVAFTALFSLGWESGFLALVWRVLVISLAAVVAFGLAERWRHGRPRWLARWVAQVLAVALAIPLSAVLIYLASTAPGSPPFWQVSDRLEGFMMFVVPGLLLGPWVALAALVRSREALAKQQALAFDLARSELERQALDARMRLLQAQVAPHFLFNTLANVRELVARASPNAPALLDSLIRYLRASTPALDGRPHTLQHELDSVRAYLELMRMRIPDRLSYRVDADGAPAESACPPMALLTLVENAVRHGIDPAEDGGTIELVVKEESGQVLARVLDTGVGLDAGAAAGGQDSGTGIAALRERLRLLHGEHASLVLQARQPRGVEARLTWPIERAHAQ